VAMKAVPPHPFSASDELNLEEPAARSPPEVTGPPSFWGSVLERVRGPWAWRGLGAVQICKGISELQCRAESGGAHRRGPGGQAPETPGVWRGGRAGTVGAKGKGAEHVEVRLKEVPPHRLQHFR
jgi:hypothetical protein